MGKKLTTEQFIEKSKAIHGDKYDYSLVEYVNSSVKVKILCKKHGVFIKTPNGHLNGQGCAICIGRKHTKDTFIENVKNIYEVKYDYSLVDFKDIDTKVKIICPKHGVFKQSPYWHLKGYSGCKHCSKKPFRSTGEFIERAKLLHVDTKTNMPKYDYSSTVYVNAKTKVIIICKEHGEFLLIPRQHVSEKRKGGCQKCSSKSISEDKIENILINKNIIFETQKRFPDCKNKKPLPFDFYLTNYNTCIEFDGIQHFEDRFFSKRKIKNPTNEVKNIQKRDEIKTKYCKEKGIILLRIKYTENIEDKLNQFFVPGSTLV